MTEFLRWHLAQVRHGGRPVLLRKVKRCLCLPHEFLLAVACIPLVVVIRLIRPWILIRWDKLPGPRIGHFAAYPEIYLCERDFGFNVPKQHHVDLFSIDKPVCNHQLAKMWKRILRVWPNWIVSSLRRCNSIIPGGKLHQICHDSHSDRDIHNLMDQCSPHLQFTAEEENRGSAELTKIGIPKNMPFVCLIVRDAAYLAGHQAKDWSYLDYRDSNIGSYLLAAEALADMGYFVIRMGARVNQSLKSTNPKVIDYATNSMRSDFMDIYLGSKCQFCISTSTGFDAVPLIFRRPIVFVNIVPIGYLHTSSAKNISIIRHHFDTRNGQAMTLKEIFAHGVGFSLRTSDYESRGIQLVENSAEEISEVVIEMAKRLEGIWQKGPDDDDLQSKFWRIFPTEAVDTYKLPLHGLVRSRIGSHFLHLNRKILES